MGQGIITVGKAVFEHHEPAEESIIIGETPKQPQSLAEWHAFLMLPEEYHLLEAKMDPMYPYWHVTVECEAIPVVAGKLTEISPIYRVEDGKRKHYLDRIELNPYSSERKVIWQRSEQ